MRKVTKQYSNGEVTIVWKNDLCRHRGICLRGLPAVFKSKGVPWIDLYGATSREIIDQVNKCPSGALSYFLNTEKPKEE